MNLSDLEKYVCINFELSLYVMKEETRNLAIITIILIMICSRLCNQFNIELKTRRITKFAY